MVTEIPQYALRAYALFFVQHGDQEQFTQSELDWIVSQSMKKKIFSVLLHAGWIQKVTRRTYRCLPPHEIMDRMMQFRVSTVMKSAEKPYSFTGLSAIEVWSDYCYVQRSVKKSPYYIKVLEGDMSYWTGFFGEHHLPCYVEEGSTIGEYIILIPVKRIRPVGKEGLLVDSFEKTLRQAEKNELYAYAADYMRRKYESATV